MKKLTILGLSILLSWMPALYAQPEGQNGVINHIYQQLITYFGVWSDDFAIPQLKKLDLLILNPAQPQNWQNTIYSNLNEGLSQQWPGIDANHGTKELLKVGFFLGDSQAKVNLKGHTFSINDSLNYLNKFAHLIPISYSNEVEQDALKPFNVGTILDNNALNEQNNEFAISFLQYASGNAIPLNIYPLRLLPTDSSKYTVAIKKYLATLGTYQALESVGVNNLMRLITERQVQPGLGEKAGVAHINAQGKKETLTDASPLQVEKFNAERRSSDPEWYSQMEKTTTPGLVRELIYIEAERRRMDMLILEELKRITTTLSAIELQTQMGLTRTLLTGSSMQAKASLNSVH